MGATAPRARGSDLVHAVPAPTRTVGWRGATAGRPQAASQPSPAAQHRPLAGSAQTRPPAQQTLPHFGPRPSSSQQRQAAAWLAS